MSEYQYAFSLEEIKRNPELLSNLLMTDLDVSICLEKKAGMVHVVHMRQHGPELSRMVAEARQEYRLQKDSGYSRDEAFQDLSDVLSEISQPQDSDD